MGKTYRDWDISEKDYTLAMIYENYMVRSFDRELDSDLSQYELLDLSQLAEAETQLRLLDYKLRNA